MADTKKKKKKKVKKEDKYEYKRRMAEELRKADRAFAQKTYEARADALGKVIANRDENPAVRAQANRQLNRLGGDYRRTVGGIEGQFHQRTMNLEQGARTHSKAVETNIAKIMRHGVTDRMGRRTGPMSRDAAVAEVESRMQRVIPTTLRERIAGGYTPREHEFGSGGLGELRIRPGARQREADVQDALTTLDAEDRQARLNRIQQHSPIVADRARRLDQAPQRLKEHRLRRLTMLEKEGVIDAAEQKELDEARRRQKAKQKKRAWGVAGFGGVEPIGPVPKMGDLDMFADPYGPGASDLGIGVDTNVRQAELSQGSLGRAEEAAELRRRRAATSDHDLYGLGQW